MTGTIDIADFMKVDIRAGTIVKVEDFPEANKPALKLTIDFGEETGLKKTSAQITDLYSKQDLQGRQVAAVVNFPPKQIGPFVSEVLTLGFQTEDKAITLIHPDHPVPNGTRLC